jgi:transposase
MLWMAPATGIKVPKLRLLLRNCQRGKPSMNEVTTIGLNLAKNVFQVHGVDASGRAVVRQA